MPADGSRRPTSASGPGWTLALVVVVLVALAFAPRVGPGPRGPVAEVRTVTTALAALGGDAAAGRTRHGSVRSSATGPESSPQSAQWSDAVGHADDPEMDGERDAAGEGRTSPSAHLARVDSLVLHVPARDPVVVGYHEASTALAQQLEPAGRLLENRNTTRFEAGIDDPGGVGYLVMSSRGRRAPATSAVDVVLPDDEAVLAPVTGVVSDVRTYWLYGAHLDTRLEIRPDAQPGLRVVLVHVSDPTVVVGDRVEGGVSVVARGPTRFPFASQIDIDTGPDRWPHVHLEVQPFDARRPGDGPDPQVPSSLAEVPAAGYGRADRSERSG